MKFNKPFTVLITIALLLATFGAYAQLTGMLEQEDDQAQAPTSAPAETDEAAETELAEVAEADPTDLPPTESPTEAAEESCIVCHSDQEALQAMAQEEAPAETLSSGEG